ncbi:MAG: hypothetical protein L0229_08390 [Blastocatellia bacterium]|nr:hypothetical protein [Blastocatellia bacterium]
MKRLLLICIYSFLFLQPVTAQAPSPKDKDSLKGLAGVNVVIEKLDPKIDWGDLTDMQLRTDVELSLRKARIQLLSSEESAKSPGAPILSVNVAALKVDGYPSLYTFSVQIHLSQIVSLQRPTPKDVYATTWSIRSVGYISRTSLPNLRDYVKDYMDVFINGWLTVNSK